MRVRPASPAGGQRERRWLWQLRSQVGIEQIEYRLRHELIAHHEVSGTKQGKPHPVGAACLTAEDRARCTGHDGDERHSISGIRPYGQRAAERRPECTPDIAITASRLRMENLGVRMMPCGFHLYRGVILTLLVLSLLVGGLPKLILALAGVFLCVGPFVASGFRYRFGVAFRDGPVRRRALHALHALSNSLPVDAPELFRTLRAPTLTLRDFGLLLYGLLFLPVVILAAQEIDKQAKNRPPAVDWTRVAALGPKGNRAPEPPRQRHARPDRPGPPQGAISRRHPTGPAAAERVTEPEPTHPAADPAPAAPAPSRLAEADTVTDQPAAGGSEIDAHPRLERAHRRPSMPFPPGQAAPPAYGPNETVTITVHGVPDFEASRRLNDAITAILKSSGSGWSLRSNTSGGKTTFIAAPVADPQAFADKIDFGKVSRVEGRSIEVDAGP